MHGRTRCDGFARYGAAAAANDCADDDAEIPHRRVVDGSQITISKSEQHCCGAASRPSATDD